MNCENKKIALNMIYQGKLLVINENIEPEKLTKRIIQEFEIDDKLFKIAGFMDYRNIFYTLEEIAYVSSSQNLCNIYYLCCQYKNIQQAIFKVPTNKEIKANDKTIKLAQTNKKDISSVKSIGTNDVDFFKVAHRLDNIDNFIDKEAEAFNYKYIITIVNTLESFNIGAEISKLLKMTDVFYYLCKDIKKFKKTKSLINSGFVNEFHESLLIVENQMVCMQGPKVQNVLEFIRTPISVEMTIKKLLNEAKSPSQEYDNTNKKLQDKTNELSEIKNKTLNVLTSLYDNHLIPLEHYLYIKNLILVNDEVLIDLVDNEDNKSKTDYAEDLLKLKDNYELKPNDLTDSQIVSILSEIESKNNKYKDAANKIKTSIINLSRSAEHGKERSPGNNNSDMLRYLKYFFIEFMTSKIDIDMFITNLQNDVSRITSTPNKKFGIESGSLKDSMNEIDSQRIYKSEYTTNLKKEEIDMAFAQIKDRFTSEELELLKTLVDKKDENLLNSIDLYFIDGDIQDFVETLQIILENHQSENKKSTANRYNEENQDTIPSQNDLTENAEYKYNKDLKKEKNDSLNIRISNNKKSDESHIPTSYSSMHNKLKNQENTMRDTVSANTNAKTVITFGQKQMTTLENGTFNENDNKLKTRTNPNPANELRMTDESNDSNENQQDQSFNSDYGISVKTVSSNDNDKAEGTELSSPKNKNRDKSCPPVKIHNNAENNMGQNNKEKKHDESNKQIRPSNYISDDHLSDKSDKKHNKNDFRDGDNSLHNQDNIFGFTQSEQMSPIPPVKYSVDSSLVNNSKGLFSPKSKNQNLPTNFLKYTNLERHLNGSKRGSSFFINNKTKRRSSTNRGRHLIQLQNVNDSAVDNDTSMISGMRSQHMSVFGDLSQNKSNEEDKVQLYDYLLEKIHNVVQEIYNNVVLFYKNVIPDPNVFNFENKLKQHLKKNANNIYPMLFRFKWKPINNTSLIGELDMYLYNVDVPDYTPLDDSFGQKRKEIVEFYYNLLDFLCMPCKHLSNNQVSFFRTQLYVKDCYVLYGNLEYFLALNDIEDFVDNLFEYEKHITQVNQTNNDVSVLDQSKFDELESQPIHYSQLINRLSTNEERNTFLTLIKMGDEDLKKMITEELKKKSNPNDLINKIRKYLKAAHPKLKALKKASTTKNWREGLKDTFEYMPQQKMDYIKNIDYIYELLDKKDTSFETEILEAMYLVWNITKDKGDFLENLFLFDKILNYKKHKEDIDKLKAIFKKQKLDENYANMFIEALFEDNNQNTKVASDMFKIFEITKDEKFLVNSVKAMFSKKSN